VRSVGKGKADTSVLLPRGFTVLYIYKQCPKQNAVSVEQSRVRKPALRMTFPRPNLSLSFSRASGVKIQGSQTLVSNRVFVVPSS